MPTKVTKSSGESTETRSAAAGGALAISVKDLSKTYTTRRGPVEAVRRSSFEVRRGEFVALVGSERVRQVDDPEDRRGPDPPQRGNRRRSAASRPSRAAGTSGSCSRRRSCFPWRTVLDNVLLPIEVFGLDASGGEGAGPRAARHGRPRGLRRTSTRGSSPAGCSSGRAWRGCWSTSRDILLMDEPFSRPRRVHARAPERRAGEDPRDARPHASSTSPTTSRRRCSCPTASS